MTFEFVALPLLVLAILAVRLVVPFLLRGKRVRPPAEEFTGEHGDGAAATGLTPEDIARRFG